VLGTPTVPALYERLFALPRERSAAMGLTSTEIVELIADTSLPEVLERVRTDDAFVRQHGLESLRETLSLDYPSYILALAMGAGKTILMGAIVATEFALALEYPDGPFVQNALIFAPGKTILGALRELAEVPFERVLPPRLHKPFAASFKLTFTRDGDSDIPVIAGSLFNLIVTNAEKIRIQKPPVRANGMPRLFSAGRDEAVMELANRRLLKIASLPHLAVFSDEAHHTYGHKLLGRWERDRLTGREVFKDDGIKTWWSGMAWARASAMACSRSWPAASRSSILMTRAVNWSPR
jgi:type III restriction enzyme